MSELRDPTPRTIHIRYTKWDGSLHWHLDAHWIDRDEYGTWGLVPPGGTYAKGTDPERIDEHGFVVLIPDGEWWTASFNAVPRGAHGHLVYVDINSAGTWDGDTLHLIDLDLDVVLDASGTVRILDEDEFADHRTRWAYPPRVVDRARATAARVAANLDLRVEPFAYAGSRRVAELLGWAHGSVVGGHGIASGATPDPRFPDGTLAEQLPFFEGAGIPVSGMFPGTINLDLQFVLTSRSPRHTIERLRWKQGYPAETFSFFDARLAAGGDIHDALVYQPHPETKPEFHQDPTVVEVLAPPIDGISPGTAVSIWVDPDQARFEPAGI